MQGVAACLRSNCRGWGKQFENGQTPKPSQVHAAARCRPVQFSSNQGKKQPVHAVMASKGGQDGGNGSAAAAAPPDYFGYTFSIENEDHTLANSLRFFLNKK
jgi:hypothetical protein